MPHCRSFIPGYSKSVAFLSENDTNVNGAVVFVHGCSGSAKSTWTDFYSLIDDPLTSDWWETRDVYFYHYRWDSVFRQISRNASSVLGFLRMLFPSPPRKLFEAREALRGEFAYSELTLVGHSEGGLLLRKAILQVASADQRLRPFHQSYNPGSPPPQPQAEGLEIAHLRLFAPAIAGEALTGFLGILANLPIIGALTHSSAAKKTMAPAGGPVTVTREETTRHAANLNMPCFRAHILWADKDSVIVEQEYAHDFCCLTRPPSSARMR